MPDILEPIILDPPGLTPEQGWQECRAFVDQCGGVTDPDGEVNWRAAFGADPGITSCPACWTQHWNWGRRVRCAKCGFAFPNDWWPMYSYGVNAAHWQASQSPLSPTANRHTRELHERRLSHPAYRYGFEHPVEDPYRERASVDWRAVLADVTTRGE